LRFELPGRYEWSEMKVPEKQGAEARIAREGCGLSRAVAELEDHQGGEDVSQ
jgi:hypothetical protein